MKRRIIISIILVSSISLILTGCGSSAKKTIPNPVSSSVKVNPTPSPITSSNDFKITSGGLTVPYTVAPIPRITSGSAYDKFGDEYVNNAYQFAFSFAYDANKISSIWEPNTKKNPLYIQYLKSELSSLGQSFAPDLQQTYNNAIPNLISPLDRSQSKLNSDAKLWSNLIILPKRKVDGVLDYPSSSKDVTNYVLMPPWDLGITLDNPIASIDTLPNYGQVLLLKFGYTVNYPIGNGKDVKEVAVVKRDLSFWIIPNSDKTSPYVWLIARWNINSNSAILYSYDPKVTGLLPAPVPHRYP